MLRPQGVIQVGAFEAHLLSDGTFALDGGAMFGTVPRTLWCRHDHPDENNRIPLALGCLLVKTPRGRWVLVDTGLSSKYEGNAKFKSIYKVERPVPLRERLKALGVAPEDIALVINTHLHFDHAGGDTEFGPDGKPRPAFPKARYLVQKLEWEDAQRPHERNQASYLAENFAPLDEAKALELVDGDYEVEPGLKVSRSGGHTRGHQTVRLESEGQTAVFLGDLVPTRSHVPLPYIMGYDLFPADTLEAKRALLSRAAAEGWTLLYQHDPRQRHSTVVRLEDGRFAAAASPA